MKEQRKVLAIIPNENTIFPSKNFIELLQIWNELRAKKVETSIGCTIINSTVIPARYYEKGDVLYDRNHLLGLKLVQTRCKSCEYIPIADNWAVTTITFKKDFFDGKNIIWTYPSKTNNSSIAIPKAIKAISYNCCNGLPIRIFINIKCNFSNITVAIQTEGNNKYFINEQLGTYGKYLYYGLLHVRGIIFDRITQLWKVNLANGPLLPNIAASFSIQKLIDQYCKSE